MKGFWKLLAGVIVGQGIALSQRKDISRKLDKAQGRDKLSVLTQELRHLNKDIVQRITPRAEDMTIERFQEVLKQMGETVSHLATQGYTMTQESYHSIVQRLESGLHGIRDQISEQYKDLDKDYHISEHVSTLLQKVTELKDQWFPANDSTASSNSHKQTTKKK